MKLLCGLQAQGESVRVHRARQEFGHDLSFFQIFGVAFRHHADFGSQLGLLLKSRVGEVSSFEPFVPFRGSGTRCSGPSTWGSCWNSCKWQEDHGHQGMAISY